MKSLPEVLGISPVTSHLFPRPPGLGVSCGLCRVHPPRMCGCTCWPPQVCSQILLSEVLPRQPCLDNLHVGSMPSFSLLYLPPCSIFHHRIGHHSRSSTFSCISVSFPPRQYSLQESSVCILSALLSPQHLCQFLSHSRCSKNISQRNILEKLLWLL